MMCRKAQYHHKWKAQQEAQAQESSDADAEEPEDEETPGEEPAAAPPSKISVAIVSTIDGKTANVKVPSNMPVNKLLQNCPVCRSAYTRIEYSISPVRINKKVF